MFVLRRIGATQTTSTTSLRPFGPQPRANTPGDVQARAQPVPPPTAPPQPPPPTPKQTCDALWSSLLAQAEPNIRTCINTSAHKAIYDQICQGMATGRVTPDEGARRWANYVATNCVPKKTVPPPTAPPYTPKKTLVPTTPPPTAPPPPPTSQPAQPPPPSQPSTPPTPGSGPGGGPGGGPSEEPSEENGFLRQVGGIVGIGLLLAVGLTVARKKKLLKLTKRRKRR